MAVTRLIPEVSLLQDSSLRFKFRESFAKHSRSEVTVTTATAGGGRAIQITASTALAGALALLKVTGREYIASGGHGSAAQ